MQRQKKSIFSEDTLDKDSATRICVLMAYTTTSLIALIDALFQKGISANAITLCGMLLFGGIGHYGLNTYKNVKGRNGAQ